MKAFISRLSPQSKTRSSPSKSDRQSPGYQREGGQPLDLPDVIPVVLPPLVEDFNDYAVLNLEKGILKGVQLLFEPKEFFGKLPDVDVMNRIMIKATELEERALKYADIDTSNVKKLGEGSYSSVFGEGKICAKFMDGLRQHDSMHLAMVAEAKSAYCNGNGPKIYGWGKCRKPGGFSSMFGEATVLFMERLDKIQDCDDDGSPTYNQQTKPEEVSFELVLQRLRRGSKYTFHNDFKIDNILLLKYIDDESPRKHKQTSDMPYVPVIIDWDLAHPFCARIAVKSAIGQAVTHCFESVFTEQEADEGQIAAWREFYDITCLTMSIRGSHAWYPACLQRLHDLFICHLELWTAILNSVEEEKRIEIPIEVICRQDGIHGVSVNLFDLVGNAFAHDVGLDEIEERGLPQLIKSNGVYWPDS